MTMMAHVVIGAQWGDEGKGLMTDVLAYGRDDAVVIRFNGGAQAGHTVETPDGLRHIFHHFGSGALVGARTHLSQHFICNPMEFVAEIADLQALGANVALSVDPDAIVTTPYDMLINQIVETSRGAGRHGSCGIGIGETVERTEDGEFVLRVRDLLGPGLPAFLERMKRLWVPRRLAQHGVSRTPENERLFDYLDNDAIIENFMHNCLAFTEHASIVETATVRAQTIIFEGAQGLRLDRTYGDFPHVTPSNTGLRNVAEIARQMGVARLQVHYMTRCYSTRHGAGPMIDERDISDYAAVVDDTNVFNPWQHGIRYGLLDATALVEIINRDLENGEGLEIAPVIGITCLDQLSGDPRWIHEGVEKTGNLSRLVHDIASGIPRMCSAVFSYGPTRKTATLVEMAAIG